MNIAKTITLELADWKPGMQLGQTAVLGDRDTRSLVFELKQEGADWEIPTGVRPALAFINTAGYRGEYDTMPDGTDAFRIDGNLVEVRLIDQIMAAAGSVTLMLVLRDQQLRQLSSYPVIIEVSAGIEGAEKLPKEYYNIRDLGEINAEFARIDAYMKEMDPEQIARAIEERGDDVFIEDGRIYLLSGEEIIGNGAQLPESGVGFASWRYDTETMLLHICDADGNDVLEPVYIPGGGGGGDASVMMLTTSLEDPTFSILDKDEACVIPFSWSSLMAGKPTGSGFAEWTVNGSRAALVAVAQGECSFDVRPYLASGAENEVVLKVTDVYGTFSMMTFTVTVTAFALSWNLSETGIHDDSDLTLRLTPTGSGEKVVKVAVDGKVVSEETVITTGRATTVTLPARSHGCHTVTAWVEATVDGEVLTTEALRHVGAWLREGIDWPVVCVLTPEVTVGQYGTAQIRWFAVDPAAETATVELAVNSKIVSTLENVGREIQTWAYKATEVGEFDLCITCGSGVNDVNLYVTDLGYDIQPVTEGLLLDLDPAGHSNSEADRLSFGYTDGSGGNHPLTFSENFDWVGGGFQTDADGVTAFVVKRGTTVTLDRGLFDSDCRLSGKSLKLIFKSENVRNYDAELMRCRSGNVGIVVQAQTATVSSQLETMNVLYCEGRRIEMNLCVNAEGEDSLAWIDLKGIQSCPPIKYGTTDSWGQSSPVPLTIGSEDADVWVYRLKLWGNSQNLYERLDDYIACAGTTGEMVERYQRNDIYNDDGTISMSKLSANNPGLRVIHLKADRMTTGKEDEVKADFEMVYGDGGKEHHLIASGVTFKAQGTSSLEYILAALNLDVDFSSADSFTNGQGENVSHYAMTDDSIPVDYFNLKANVASSESANNVCLADEYNTWNPYICAPRAADSRVRDTVEGHPCAVFFTSTADAAIEVGARTVQPGETILYFVGDMNNSKKNFGVFGQDNGKWPRQCCVEVMNNTELPCRFRQEISDNETWKGGNFEFRFPKNPTDEMKAAFTAMQRWVVSTDRDAASGAAFTAPVTIDGTVYAEDTAQYRAAKFKAEFADYFVTEAMDFHYLFTDENCMTDNRAKNLFFCYEYVQALDDYRWSVRCDYDNDTALGNDNSGGLTFAYGLEDTDMVGDSWVFNAHDSVLWCNIRDLRAEELTSLHTRLAGQGAWDSARRAKKFREYQSAVCEALRAEDMHNKYFLPWLLKDAAAYAAKCLGTKEDQREQFLPYQEVCKASRYIDVSNRSDAISMRVTVETAENGNLTITAFSDMYIVVMYGNGGRVSKRVKRNVPTLIECPTDSLGDTETYIFMASNLTAISSLAGMKPKFVLATTARRLQELIIGSGEIGYVNLNLNQIGVGNNQMLRLLDLRGCPNLVTALDLSALTSLERFLANGSGITGVTFARGCPLEEIRIPAVSSLVALELKAVQTFLMDSSELTLLRIEDCPGIDSLAICKGAGKLERGRLTNVDWSDSDAAVLHRLAGLAGYDGQGKPTEQFVLTGKAHVDTISQLQIDAITAAFPELELSYGEIVESVTVTFQNWDGTVWHEATQVIPSGANAVNPVTAGYIDRPAKASDVEYHYSFTGWDKALTNITADTTFTAQYIASDRYYRVTHWQDEAQTRVLQEENVIAHGDGGYQGEDPELDGKLWAGWDADTGDVVCDMDVHAVYLVPELPDSVPQEYDYLYSDDPADNCGFTASQFFGILYYGMERSFFRIGDRIRLLTKTDAFTDTEFILELRSYRHFMSAERSGEWAGPYFGMVGVMNSKQKLYSESSNVGGFPMTTMLPYLNDVVYPGLPGTFRNLMEKFEVLSSAGNASTDIVSAETFLTLESHAELGFEADVVPYCNEVADGADEVTFSCYTDNNSRIKKMNNGGGTSMDYWLRSPEADNDYRFREVTTSGTGWRNPPANAFGVSFGLCLRSGYAEQGGEGV